MALLDAMPSQAYYTVRTHYYDSHSKRYVYRWQPVRYLGNLEALDWVTGLEPKYGLQSENVLFQWDGSSWQRIA